MNIFDKTVEVVGTVDNTVNKVVGTGVDILLKNGEDFFKFIIDRNIISLGVAFIIAGNLNNFSAVLSEFIFAPIIQRISAGKIKDVDKYTVKILGMELKIGMVIKALINLLIVILIIYYIMQLFLSLKIDNIKGAIKTIQINEGLTVDE